MKTLFIKDLLLNKVENIVAKGEIAHYKQYPLLPQSFLKLSTAEASKVFALSHMKQICNKRL